MPGNGLALRSRARDRPLHRLHRAMVATNAADDPNFTLVSRQLPLPARLKRELLPAGTIKNG